MFPEVLFSLASSTVHFGARTHVTEYRRVSAVPNAWVDSDQMCSLLKPLPPQKMQNRCGLPCGARKCLRAGQLSESETIKRRNDGLRRAINTSPTPHKVAAEPAKRPADKPRARIEKRQD